MGSAVIIDIFHGKPPKGYIMGTTAVGFDVYQD